MQWTQPPSLTAVEDAILTFFDHLPVSTVQALATVHVKPHAGSAPAATLDFHLRSLWEDLEDWLDDLEDPSFAGDWQSRLTPLRALPRDAVGWTVFSDDPQRMSDGDSITVTVHYLAEPTDCGARFEVLRTDAGYVLALDSIRLG
ncbi:MAG: hypothetical protein ACN6O6_09990 [Pseudomonas sp.]|uniref:hypothetical protein n=1 Tax=Pseudomonas sp. TaxID=306 RepID=UPI003D12FE6A